jgi:hypothetical protein
MDEDREQRIRERAYQLWEQAGRPEEGTEDFWGQAEQQLEQEETDSVLLSD